MESCCLTSLPDLVLVKILRYFTIQDLLQTIAKTCKRLNSIVESNSKLWSRFEPDWFSSVRIEQLHRILRRSVALTEFVIPYGTFTCSVPEIDFLFITELTNAKSLTWMDIPMSTLSFLNFLQNIEILNVSDCRNLFDADFSVVKTCKNLSQMYADFTIITPDTILSICDCLTLIVVDVAGIPLQLGHCERIFHPSFCTFNSHQTIGRTNPCFKVYFVVTAIHLCILFTKSVWTIKILSRGKALVNLALANTSNQAAQRYTIQGHNILNEQDREIKNTTQQNETVLLYY